VALFAHEIPAKEAADLLQLQPFFEGCSVIGLRPVAPQDWVRLVVRVVRVRVALST
jgi:ribosomal protein L11 methyltransferase